MCVAWSLGHLPRQEFQMPEIMCSAGVNCVQGEFTFCPQPQRQFLFISKGRWGKRSSSFPDCVPELCIIRRKSVHTLTNMFLPNLSSGKRLWGAREVTIAGELRQRDRSRCRICWDFSSRIHGRFLPLENPSAQSWLWSGIEIVPVSWLWLGIEIVPISGCGCQVSLQVQPVPSIHAQFTTAPGCAVLFRCFPCTAADKSICRVPVWGRESGCFFSCDVLSP